MLMPKKTIVICESFLNFTIQLSANLSKPTDGVPTYIAVSAYRVRTMMACRARTVASAVMSW